MNINIAFVLFSFVVLVYWIIMDFFTMLFRFTGLPVERARFQVMSLLTDCGFTTRESEAILAFRPRRRLAFMTMVFGYAFNITIVSAFINVFLSLKLVQKENMVLSILIPFCVVLLIILLLKVQKVREWENRFFEMLAQKILNNPSTNTVLLLDHIGQGSIAQISLRELPEHLRGKELRDTGLRADLNILVMLVERGGKKAEPPTAETIFEVGDKLTVFGDYQAICRSFEAREQFMDDQ